MSYTKLFILAVMLCIGMASCNSDSIPEKVVNAFAQKYPSVSQINWSLDSHRNYEAKFKLDGIKHRADFDYASGNWIETEVSIRHKDLPAAVQNSIRANYDRDKISEIEKVDHFLKGHFYDVEFELDGKKFDVEFNEEGAVVGFE